MLVAWACINHAHRLARGAGRTGSRGRRCHTLDVDDQGRKGGGVETSGAPAATGADNGAATRWTGAWRAAIVALVTAGVALRVVFLRGRWGPSTATRRSSASWRDRSWRAKIGRAHV